MKKFIGIILLAVASLSLASCGSDYYDVTTEYHYLGTTVEYTGDFQWTEGLGYNMYAQFDEGLLYDSDGIMVYILWENADGLDVWRPLPETTYTDYGNLTYSYDYTQYDITFYLKTDYDPYYLLDGDIFGQTFRVVTLPSEFKTTKSTKAMDYDTLMKTLEDAGYKYQVIERTAKQK